MQYAWSMHSLPRPRASSLHPTYLPSSKNDKFRAALTAKQIIIAKPRSILRPKLTPRRHSTPLTTMPPLSQTIFAPSREPPRGLKSVFLAGTTSRVDPTDWRETLASLLSNLPITIYNPYRPDWDSTWREDINFTPYREQVEWELEKQDEADMVVVYFHPATQAPVSLLEFGLCARVPGKAIVYCPEGYWKRGNVQVVCRRFGVEMVESVEGLRGAIVRRMGAE